MAIRAKLFVGLIATTNTWLALVSMCTAFYLQEQQSQIKTLYDWKNAKLAFLAEIDRSHKDIFSQLENFESDLRQKGDLKQLMELKETRSAFAEKGEIRPPVSRDNYDLIRKQAQEVFATKKQQLVSKALQDRDDSIAQLIDQEFNELLEPLQFDIEARWTAAVLTYQAEMEQAKSTVIAQLDKAEAQARDAGNPKLVDEIKKEIQQFTENGTVPKRVSSTAFDAQAKKAMTRLEQVNRSLVRTLLLASRDDKAKTLAAALEAPIDSITNSTPEKPPVADSRMVWLNNSYKTVFRQDADGKWREFDSAGKFIRDVKELSRNEKFVEVMLVDRQHLMRIFEEHAEIYKDGKWQWVAHGVWEKK